jgi:hypothetical protein
MSIINSLLHCTHYLLEEVLMYSPIFMYFNFSKTYRNFAELLMFRTKEFLLLSSCHGVSYGSAYALPSTIASNLFFSKTTTPTNFIFYTHVDWVSANLTFI